MSDFKPKALRDQVIVITGASSGIGLATAKMAASKGARVVIASRNRSELDKIASDLRGRHAKVLAVQADVSKVEDLAHLRDRAIQTFGRIDTWVNNAGLSIYGFALDVPEEEERKLFDINFWGVRNGSHVAIPALRRNGGVLINVGSEVSEVAVPLQAAYSASKHAVKAYTNSLRMELEKEGDPIELCLIRPAGIDTPFTEHAVNHLREGEPSLPPPVYHPDVVARAILHCAVHPQRDVYVGGPSRFFEILASFVPGLMDAYMEKKLFAQQSAGGTEMRLPRNEALQSSPPKEGDIRGDFKGRAHRISAYTSASLHPFAAALSAGAFVLALGSVLQFLKDREGFKKDFEKAA